MCCPRKSAASSTCSTPNPGAPPSAGAALRALEVDGRPALELVFERGSVTERALARSLLDGTEPESTRVASWIADLGDPDSRRRWGAVSELGSRQETSAIPAIVAGLVRCRDDPGDWHVYWRSLWALNNMPVPKAAAPLVKAALVAGGAWHDRWNAAVALAYLRVEDADAVAFLLHTLDEDRPTLLKSFSITSLSYAGSDALFTVVPRFIDDPAVQLRQAVLDALRNWPADDPRRVPPILHLLGDASDQVRWRAAMHLRRHRGPEVAAALRERLAIESDANVRKHLEQSLEAQDTAGTGGSSP